jgi:hypothetical protein
MRILVLIGMVCLTSIMARTAGTFPAVIRSKIFWRAIFEYCNGRERYLGNKIKYGAKGLNIVTVMHVIWKIKRNRLKAEDANRHAT